MSGGGRAGGGGGGWGGGGGGGAARVPRCEGRPRAEPDMPGLSRRRMEITNAFGLHLRAASRSVQLSRQFRAEVRALLQRPCGRWQEHPAPHDVGRRVRHPAGTRSGAGPRAAEARHRRPLRLKSRPGSTMTRKAGTSVSVPDSLDGPFQPPHRRYGEGRSGGRPRS